MNSLLALFHLLDRKLDIDQTYCEYCELHHHPSLFPELI